jgi:hypothetical protein
MISGAGALAQRFRELRSPVAMEEARLCGMLGA